MNKFGTLGSILALLLAGCGLLPEEVVIRPGDFTPPEEMRVDEVADTADVGCFDDPKDSRAVRGPVVASPDARFLAFVEIEIVANQAGGDDAYPPCANTSRLYLSTPTVPDFQSIFARVPSDLVTGGSIWIVDWSADGRYLLFGESEWEYDEDYYWRTYWLHDAQDNFPRMINPDPLVSGHFGLECEAHPEVAGFSKEGKLVLSISPEEVLDFERELEERILRPESEDEERLPSCVERDTFLLLDPVTNRLTPLPEDYSLQYFGMRE